ncbi:MAG UNVERIFIED_CONTAM: hypothetical protein LVT10_15470 [Anaerolineae bacterium]
MPSWLETSLLALATAFMLSNIVFWVLLNGYNPTLLSLFVAWLICIVVGSILLRRALPTHDPFLFPVACLMTGWDC